MEPPSHDFREEYEGLTAKQQIGLRQQLLTYAVNHHGWKAYLDLELEVDRAISDALRPGEHRPEGISPFTFLIMKLRHRVHLWWLKESSSIKGEDCTNEVRAGHRPRRVLRRQPLEALDELNRRTSGPPGASEIEREVERAEIYDKLLKIVRDPLIRDIIGVLKQDHKSQLRDIAAVLGVSKEELYKAEKRLKRVLKKLRKEWFDDEK